MTILLVTTVRRHTPYTEPSGYIYTVDLEAEMVLQRCLAIEPPFREVDNNPRGGLRGSRGIAIRDDQIAIANASMIVRYDPQWNLLGVITHACCAALHDIVFQDDTLWLTAARIDLLMQFDLSSKLLRYYYMRDPSLANKAMNWYPSILLKPEQIYNGDTDYRDTRTHEEEIYDWAHLNSIGILPAGDILVSLGLVLDTKFATLLRIKSRLVRLGIWPWLLAVNRQIRDLVRLRKNMHSDLVIQPAQARSAVVRISPKGDHSLSLILPEATVPSHSLLVLPDETVVYLNTTQGAVVHFQPYTGEMLSSTVVTEGFLRGVTLLPDQTLLLGSKQDLLKFDLDSRKLIGSMKIIDDPNESVYDIKVLPPHYSLPPASFEDHFMNTASFKADEIITRGRQFRKA